MSFFAKIEQRIEALNQFADMEVGKANIKVFGVGGAGNNMVNWLYKKAGGSRRVTGNAPGGECVTDGQGAAD